MIAGFLALAGCLVTNELDFTATPSLLNVKRVSPPSPYPVPSIGSDECDEDQLSFVAQYYYEDVRQKLTVLPLVNDEQLFGAFSANPDPGGSPEHVAPLICIPLPSLTRACNRVEIFVSDDPLRLFVPDPNKRRNDPRVQSVTWFLYGSAASRPGTPAQPYTSFSDCLPPDGGT